MSTRLCVYVDSRTIVNFITQVTFITSCNNRFSTSQFYLVQQIDTEYTFKKKKNTKTMKTKNAQSKYL